MVGGDLLDHHATTDRLHGDPGLELGAMDAALTHGWELLLGAVPRLRGERWDLSRKTSPPHISGKGMDLVSSQHLGHRINGLIKL